MFGAKANAAFAAVFLLSLSASVVAQSEESAAIIQTTLMDFRVTGSAASNFSTSSQQAFSDNLRSLLSSFNFMSLSVSDFKARHLPGCCWILKCVPVARCGKLTIGQGNPVL